MHAPQFDLFGDATTSAVSVPGIRDALHISTVSFSASNTGSPRLNIENRTLLALSGITAGCHVRPEFGADFVYLRRLARAAHDSIAVVGKSYPNRDQSETTGARVDLRRAQLRDVFGNEATLLVAYCDGGLLITLLPTRKVARQRWESLARAAQSGKLTTGSLYTGFGTLDAAAHAGLEAAGYIARSVFANDIWGAAIEALLADNPARPKHAFACGIDQLLAMGDEAPLPTPDILIMGVPCKGASKLNIEHRDMPELHPVVGHQVLNVAMFLRGLKFAPAIIVLENVIPWSDTVSYSMLVRVLDEQGYKTMLVGDREGEVYRGLLGSDFGDMERRRRMALIGYPPELDEHLDFTTMTRRQSSTTVADIRLPEDQIPADEYEKGLGLAAKAAKGFNNKIVNDTDTTTPPMSASCWKQRPEDPKFRKPGQPDNSRLPKPEEHARLKGQPERLIRSLAADTHAHTALGNGTTRKLWTEFFRSLGVAMQSASARPVALAA